MRMEKKEEEMRDTNQLTHEAWKTKASRISLTYCKLSLSKALAISSLISIAGVLVDSREWTTSLANKMLSRICHPST
jgi:hypothetical protein